MSRWLELEAELAGIDEDLSTQPTPQGSEGGSPFRKSADSNSWYVSSNLRDMDDYDTREISNWFHQLCVRFQPSQAELFMQGWKFSYLLFWDKENQILQLELPNLYQDYFASIGGGNLDD